MNRSSKKIINNNTSNINNSTIKNEKKIRKKMSTLSFLQTNIRIFNEKIFENRKFENYWFIIKNLARKYIYQNQIIELKNTQLDKILEEDMEKFNLNAFFFSEQNNLSMNYLLN